jgi:hypothetical protein
MVIWAKLDVVVRKPDRPALLPFAAIAANGTSSPWLFASRR